jgi:hypothetical protein
MLDADFSRAAFEATGDAQALCARLSELLSTRMRSAANRYMELEWIVADLRAIGHHVHHWDGVIANWDDRRQDPYLWIAVGGTDLDDPGPEVSVSWRPRLPEAVVRCPLCWGELAASEIFLDVLGHGSATAPSMRVRFQCPGMPPFDEPVGARSFQRRQNVRHCTSCGLFLGPR